MCRDGGMLRVEDSHSKGSRIESPRSEVSVICKIES